MCEEGSAGEFTWTPDSNTPDVVYYQVIMLITLMVFSINIFFSFSVQLTNSWVPDTCECWNQENSPADPSSHIN